MTVVLSNSLAPASIFCPISCQLSLPFSSMHLPCPTCPFSLLLKHHPLTGDISANQHLTVYFYFFFSSCFHWGSPEWQALGQVLLIERGDDFAFKELPCGGETERVGPSKRGGHVPCPAYCHPVVACAQHVRASHVQVKWKAWMLM